MDCHWWEDFDRLTKSYTGQSMLEVFGVCYWIHLNSPAEVNNKKREKSGLHTREVSFPNSEGSSRRPLFGRRRTESAGKNTIEGGNVDNLQELRSSKFKAESPPIDSGSSFKPQKLKSTVWSAFRDDMDEGRDCSGVFPEKSKVCKYFNFPKLSSTTLMTLFCKLSFLSLVKSP